MGGSEEGKPPKLEDHCIYCGVIEGQNHDRNCPDRKRDTLSDRVPSSLRRMVVWSEEDLREFRRKVNKFKKDPQAYAEFLEDGVILHTLILDKLVKEPPPGRIGAQVLASAIKEFRGIADDVHGELQKQAALKEAQKRGTKSE